MEFEEWKIREEIMENKEEILLGSWTTPAAALAAATSPDKGGKVSMDRRSRRSLQFCKHTYENLPNAVLCLLTKIKSFAKGDARSAERFSDE